MRHKSVTQKIGYTDSDLQNWIKGEINGSLLYIPNKHVVYLRYEVEFIGTIIIDTSSQKLYWFRTRNSEIVIVWCDDNNLSIENFIYHN